MSQHIFSIFFISVAFIVWMPVCISKYRKWRHRKQHCNRKVTARIVEIREKKAARGGMMYKPVFHVSLDNETHIIDSAYYTAISSMETGQPVELLVNPDDCQEFLYADERYNYGKVTDIIFCLIPVFFTAIIIIVSMAG